MLLHTLFWVTTGLVAAWMLAGATAIFLRKAFIHDAIVRLGYPPYFPWILGTAKAIGALLLLLPLPSWMPLFAYAGASIELLTAALSYAVVVRKASEWLKPLVLLGLVWTSLGLYLCIGA